MTALRRNGTRHRKTISLALAVAAIAVLFSIPIGNFGGAGASAAYYYYNPGGGPATLVLTPAAATNTVGTMHTVTATVTQGGNPIESVIVNFSVTGSVTLGGSCTTDANGMCSFSYSGPALPGADVITAFADLNNNGTRDADEPTATATKAWVLPASTTGHVTGGGQISVAGDDVTFGFNAKSTGGDVKGGCTVVDHDTGTKIKCLDATALVQSGNEATIYGHASQDGGPATMYVIHVVDNGESGGGQDTFSIATGSGYSASGTLTAGNIQVH